MTGDDFRQALKAVGYNQGQFAAVMGVHRTLIAQRQAVVCWWK